MPFTECTMWIPYPTGTEKDGFVTTQFDENLLADLIRKEKGLFVAVDNGNIVAYVMAASWEYCSRWPSLPIYD